jgi:hypothetical protein
MPAAVRAAAIWASTVPGAGAVPAAGGCAIALPASSSAAKDEAASENFFMDISPDWFFSCGRLPHLLSELSKAKMARWQRMRS